MKKHLISFVILLLTAGSAFSQTEPYKAKLNLPDSLRFRSFYQDSITYQSWFKQFKVGINEREGATYPGNKNKDRHINPNFYPSGLENFKPHKTYSTPAWRKENKSKESWTETRRLSLLSFGIGAAYRRQYYDNEMMNLFKGTSSFSLDVDMGINDLIITANFAWGGGRLYDSLAANYWEWLPYTRVSTNTSGIFVAYPAIDEAFGKISPFVGMQQIKLRLKPDFYMLTPVGLNNTLESKYVYSLGFHYDLIGYDYSYNGKFYNGFGLRFSYAWSIIQFDEFKGFMHQLTIGLFRSYRAVRPK